MSELEQLTKRIEYLERRVSFLERNAPATNPWERISPPVVQPPITTAVGRCIKCGVSLSGTMGYVCSDTSCPCGFGPAI